MPLTYTYKITSLKVKDETVNGQVNKDAVVQTYWKCTGTDEEGNSGVFDGATPFTTTTMPEDYDFVAFENLTEDVVIEWIKAVVEKNTGYQQHIAEVIQEKINQTANPIKDANLPWAPPPAPEPPPTSDS